MTRKATNGGFAVYFDPKKSTSGQRFFGTLSAELEKHLAASTDAPRVLLFNVSGPIKAILAAKWRGQKVVLRIDGLYADRLSTAFLATFPWPLRCLLAVGLNIKWAHDVLATVANFLSENYRAFARMVLADRIIYQSSFSQRAHSRYFPRKPYTIIVNGAKFRAGSSESIPRDDPTEIRVITIYDDWKPAKRMNDIIRFVVWAREVEEIELQLTLLGYTGRIPAGAPTQMKTIIEGSDFIRVLGRFESFDGAVKDALAQSDLYLTFAYRDPCPNVVVEAMAHGLPVVGVASGGVPDIVGDAGILVSPEDQDAPFFSAHRYEHEFPPIDFDAVARAVRTVASEADRFRARVRQRFEDDLDIGVVTRKYANALTQFEPRGSH